MSEYNIKKVEIEVSCWFERFDFNDAAYPSEVTLEYIEKAQYPGYSDTETSHDINKEKAQEIIDFLKESFDI